LIRERLDLVNEVQQVVTLLHRAREIATNERDVGKTFNLINIAKDISRLCKFFATFDVRNFVVR
jgi:hypothetical protein